MLATFYSALIQFLNFDYMYCLKKKIHNIKQLDVIFCLRIISLVINQCEEVGNFLQRIGVCTGTFLKQKIGKLPAVCEIT
jgi:hypothetical protein